MVQFLSINFFLGCLQFLLGFSKVPVFFVSPSISGRDFEKIQLFELLVAS